MNNYEIKQRIGELVRVIYNDYSCVGGALHIVLDDFNLEDDDIEYCLNKIKNIVDEKERAIYTECAESLLKLSYSSRKRTLESINYCEL